VLLGITAQSIQPLHSALQAAPARIGQRMDTRA
jgi:hypothetical protein